MFNIENYENPFDALLAFEKMLGEYTGAPYVVVTDCCTHAMELCIRLWRRGLWRRDKVVTHSIYLPTIAHRTYLSVPMMIHILGYTAYYEELDWEADGKYAIKGIADDRVYDCARLFEEDMYVPGTQMCLSFGHGKPLQIGSGGAILLDNKYDYKQLKMMSYDGRDIHSYDKWADQQVFCVGYHYNMRPEAAVKGMRMINDGEITKVLPFYYPDLREIKIYG